MNLVAKMKSLLADAIRIGRITAVDNNADLQTVTVDVRVGVIDTKVPRIQNYGHASNPKVGNKLMGVEVTVNGNRFVVALDDMNKRPKGGEAGDVWLYHDEGHIIHMTKDKVINVEAETLNMNVPQTNWTGNISLTGDIDQEGNINLTGDIDQDGKHESTGDQIAGEVSQIHHDHDYHPGPLPIVQTGEANASP